MKRSKKLFAVSLLLLTLTLSTNVARAGIIVGFAPQDQETNPCEKAEKATISKKVVSTINSGIIVGFTGIIVGLTGIIVGYSDSNTECGYIPTSD